MKSNARWMIALAVISGAYSNSGNSLAASKEAEEATAIMSNYESEQRAAATARAKDPAWKPSCDEVGLIQIGDSKRPGALKNFCLNADGNILACFVPNEIAKPSAGKNGPAIRVYSPKGELLKTLPLEIKATAICVAKDGSIFVAGDGRVQKLDAGGKVLASATSPVANETVTIGKETEDMVKEMIKQSKRSFKEELASMNTMLEKRRSEVTGLTATEQDVFMAVPAPSDFTYRVYRFDHALLNPKLVVEKLRGCCGLMDITAHEGNLWIAHNARHTVESRDRDGGQLVKFGTAGKVRANDFGGCCEPKNLRVLANGDILAAESEPNPCIKRFSASGKFLGVVAVLKTEKPECLRVTVEASPDGSRFYLLETKRDAIRIFGTKS